jgi:hypothetical protein
VVGCLCVLVCLQGLIVPPQDVFAASVSDIYSFQGVLSAVITSIPFNTSMLAGQCRLYQQCIACARLKWVCVLMVSHCAALSACAVWRSVQMHCLHVLSCTVHTQLPLRPAAPMCTLQSCPCFYVGVQLAFVAAALVRCL